MSHSILIACSTVLLGSALVSGLAAESAPFDGKTFHGRIAFSSDGNCNDEDDWGAFPVAAALLEAFKVTNKLVHVDHSNILPMNDPRFYAEMQASVLGSVERFNIPAPIVFDCQQDLEGAIASIQRAINASSIEDPLYYVLAGPMEVPLLGILKSDPSKRKYVYCISHSGWNDGFSQPEKLHLHRYTKRDVIETGVNWVQIKPGSGLTNSTRTSSTPDEWKLYSWMRDSRDPRLAWIYARLQVEERCDVSDATMTYFLLTGDEGATPAKLNAALEEKTLPQPITQRKEIRLEAENFRVLENFAVEHKADRKASHRLSVQQSGTGLGRIRTSLNQPYAADHGVFDIEVRYLDERPKSTEFTLFIGNVQQGASWQASGENGIWQSKIIRNVTLLPGNEIVLETRVDGEAAGKLDYVQLSFVSE